jgi:hypothetical protein
MSHLKTQFGNSQSSDFETWTFSSNSQFVVTTGQFAITPKQKYDKLLVAIRGMRNSMNAHPDCYAC